VWTQEATVIPPDLAFPGEIINFGGPVGLSGGTMVVGAQHDDDDDGSSSGSAYVFGLSDPDTDGDGVPDGEDAFPDDPYEWEDTDGNDVGDNGDAFPYDPVEWDDTDGDDVGDNGDV